MDTNVFPDPENMDVTSNERYVGLLLANQKRIYGFILAMVPNLSDADDIMQETAMTMCRKFEQFKPGTNFPGGAMAVARSKIIRFRQKQGSSKVQFTDDAFQQILDRSETLVSNIDNRARALELCLIKLKDDDRSLIEMRYEQSNRINEIAAKVGRPVHGLYKAMARIHNLLRQCVERTMAAWETA
jgi:RNA polymerase sigma-70 factor (ECF subfamily)